MEYVGADKLFATHVARYKLPEIVDELTKVYDYYDADDSLWDYNQTFNVHVLDEHKTLQDKIVAVAKDWLLDRLKYNCDVQMTTSWLTRTPAELYGSNVHTHHNSWWSGVYYFQDECAIQFDSVLAQLNSIDALPKDFNLDTTNVAVYEPKKGEMLLFPSQTSHMVVKKENKQYKNIRASLAFNFMPKGIVGIYDSQWEYK